MVIWLILDQQIKSPHIFCHLENQTGETMSPKLHRVQVPLMSRSECEKRFRTAGYRIEIDKTKVCAGLPEGGKDACQVVDLVCLLFPPSYLTFRCCLRDQAGISPIS